MSVVHLSATVWCFSDVATFVKVGDEFFFSLLCLLSSCLFDGVTVGLILSGSSWDFSAGYGLVSLGGVFVCW